MYDTLLFLHVLAAFMLVVTAVTYSAAALGAVPGGRTMGIANVCWDLGSLATLVLGIWLAIYVDGYAVWDGWIIAAVVVWAVATETGRRAHGQLGSLEGPSRPTLMHWLRTALVVVLLVLMVWKPGA